MTYSVVTCEHCSSTNVNVMQNWDGSFTTEGHCFECGRPFLVTPFFNPFIRWLAHIANWRIRHAFPAKAKGLRRVP